MGIHGRRYWWYSHHIRENLFGYGGELIIELRQKTLIEGDLVSYFDTVDASLSYLPFSHFC